MIRPSGCLFAHPANGLDDFNVRDLNRAMKNRLMVRDTIPESPQSIEASVDELKIELEAAN